MTENPEFRATTEVDPQRGSRYSRTNAVNLRRLDVGPPAWEALVSRARLPLPNDADSASKVDLIGGLPFRYGRGVSAEATQNTLRKVDRAIRWTRLTIAIFLIVIVFLILLLATGSGSATLPVVGIVLCAVAALLHIPLLRRGRPNRTAGHRTEAPLPIRRRRPGPGSDGSTDFFGPGGRSRVEGPAKRVGVDYDVCRPVPVGHASAMMGDDGVECVPLLVAHVGNGKLRGVEARSKLPQARIVNGERMEALLLDVAFHT